MYKINGCILGFPPIAQCCATCEYFIIFISETTPSTLPLIWIVKKKMSMTGSRTYWVWVTDGHLLRKAHFGGICSQASFLGCTYEGRFRRLKEQNREKEEEEVNDCFMSSQRFLKKFSKLVNCAFYFSFLRCCVDNRGSANMQVRWVTFDKLYSCTSTFCSN